MLTNCCLFLGFTWEFFQSYNSVSFFGSSYMVILLALERFCGFFLGGGGEARGALWKLCGLTEEEKLDNWNGATDKQTWGCITKTDQSIWSIFRFWWNIYPTFFQPQEEWTKPVFIEQKIVFTSKLYVAVQESSASGFQSILVART